MSQVPPLFLQRVRRLLQDEAFAAFLEALGEPPVVGLRVNLLKTTPEAFRRLVDWPLEPVPWCPEGFRLLGQDVRPGKHPYHAAGLYYIQEPSAMAPAALLDPQPGEWVLDLAAAPGGKTTQLAARMGNQGLLVANDVQPRRLRELTHNLDRWGATHVVVTQALPGRLARSLGPRFHRVLVDAPCSGEGMFRKDPKARRTWSPNLVQRCAGMQLGMLKAAAHLVRPGGWLLYSTCTFAVEENEGVLARFLEAHPEFELQPVPRLPGFAPGLPEALDPPGPPSLRHAVRLWPHRVAGEGHFVALLRRREGPEPEPLPPWKPQVPHEARRLFRTFVQEHLTEMPVDEARLHLVGSQLYALPEGMPRISGLAVHRWGWWLGTVKKGRFEPSHALALALQPHQVRQVLRLELEDPRLATFFAGGHWPDAGPKGWVLVTVGEFPLGWARRGGGYLKSRAPRWLRRWE